MAPRSGLRPRLATSYVRVCWYDTLASAVCAARVRCCCALPGGGRLGLLLGEPAVATSCRRIQTRTTTPWGAKNLASLPAAMIGRVLLRRATTLGGGCVRRRQQQHAVWRPMSTTVMYTDLNNLRFDDHALKASVAPETYAAFHTALESGGALEKQDANAVAAGMAAWAQERGASMFAHWFSPVRTRAVPRLCGENRR